MENIIVAFSDENVAKNIRNLLVRSGIRVTGTALTGAQASSIADDLDGGILICGFKFPDMLFTELLENMPQGFSMILIASRRVLEERAPSGICALETPLQAEKLLEAIDEQSMLLRRARKARHEKPREKSGEDIRDIDRAKALLMEQRKMTEPEAHRYLQRKSMENGTSLADTARMVALLLTR